MIIQFVRFAFRIPKAGVVLCVAALAGGMASPGLGAQNSRAGGTKDIPLRINFGMDAAHKITNDALEDYVDNFQSVFAVLYEAGNQGFNTQADTRQAAVRSLYFGVGAPQPGAPDFPAAGYANAIVVMIGYAGDSVYPASSVSIQNMTAVGQFDQRLVRFNWTVGSYRYRLGLGTDMNADDQPDAAPAVVTCTVVVNNRCTTWTLRPQGPAAVYRAELTVGKGGKVDEGPNTYVGHYYMPFVETLTLK